MTFKEFAKEVAPETMNVSLVKTLVKGWKQAGGKDVIKVLHLIRKLKIIPYCIILVYWVFLGVYYTMTGDDPGVSFVATSMLIPALGIALNYIYILTICEPVTSFLMYANMLAQTLNVDLRQDMQEDELAKKVDEQLVVAYHIGVYMERHPNFELRKEAENANNFFTCTMNLFAKFGLTEPSRREYYIEKAFSVLHGTNSLKVNLAV